MIYILKLCIVILPLLSPPRAVFPGKFRPSDFDKALFYSVLAGQELARVDAQLAVIQKGAGSDKDAYEGALLMKKAGLVSRPTQKLSLFKAGRAKLEAAIQHDPGNAEYRFLRLIIQEHAPKIVRYRKDISNDAAILHTSFKTLAPVVQQAIADYAAKSTVSKPADF